MHPSGAQTPSSKTAFTLAEVMMASVVLLIAVVGLIEAVTLGAGMLNVSRKQTIALQVIRAEIEAVHLNNTWTQATPPDGVTGPILLENVASGTLGYPELVSLENVGPKFSLTRTIYTVRSTSNWLKKVTFTVTWSESTGRSYTRTGYTYCAKNGVNALYQH